MNDYIAYCGLNCETCEARIATVNNDDELRVKVANLWSELNGAEISPEMINCTGCRIQGAKYPYCRSMCPIRKCAAGEDFSTCAECAHMDSCEKLKAITDGSEDALRNLLNLRKL